MSEGTQEYVKVLCACGRTLKAPARTIGRKARCTGCGTILTVQASAAPPPPPPPPPPRPVAVEAPDEVGLGDDDLDGLYALAGEEKRASRTAVPDPRCPQCFAAMAPNAVICVSCGYDVQTGKAIASAAPTAAVSAPKVEPPMPTYFGRPGIGQPGGKPVVDAMAPQGKFLLGLAGSAAGGVLGGIVWFAIAMVSGYELGFIALLVGILTGLGMQIGQKGYSTLGGVTAAGMALVAIIVAKIAVIVAVLMPLMAAEQRLAGYDNRVVHMLMEEELASQGLDYAETSVEQDEAAMELVEKKLAAMSQPEIDALVARADEREQKEELIAYLTSEMLEAQGSAQFNEMQYAVFEKRATDRVEAMTPDERRTELARLEAKSEAAMETARAEFEAEYGSGDAGEMSESGGSGVAAGAGALVLLLLIFGWKSIIFLLVGMSIAYKTAAGAVSG